MEILKTLARYLWLPLTAGLVTAVLVAPCLLLGAWLLILTVIPLLMVVCLLALVGAAIARDAGGLK